MTSSSSSAGAALTAAYREDTLWSKYKEIKKVLDVPVPPPTSLPRTTTTAESCAKMPTAMSGAEAKIRTLSRHTPRYDDSGRFVDMTEVAQGVFVGSE